MNIERHKTKAIKIGKIPIGANNPVAIQSMVKVRTSCVNLAINQINDLEAAGCEIVRLAVKDYADARALKEIKKKVKLPLVADIHFDYRLALEAIASGVDKIRLNPGNIYQKKEIRAVAWAAKARHIPIRVGLNSGSLPKSPKRKATNAEVMCKSALDYIKILEDFGFTDIVISLKASNIFDTIEANRRMAELCHYPLHLGLTATGLPRQGLVKSSIAIGALLLEGIGDTFRISLTDNPIEEVTAAKDILIALGLRCFGPEIISCPTCGRCEVDLRKIVSDLEKKLLTVNGKRLTQPIKLAIMGCVVNGPGEAKEADIGVAFGKKDGLLFKKGKAIKKISYNDCVNILLREIK